MADRKALAVRRSFVAPPKVTEVKSRKTTETIPSLPVGATPTTSVQWLQLVSHLLLSTGNNRPVEDRTLLLCEEAAGMLLEDDARARATRKRNLTAAEAETAVYSPQETGEADQENGEGENDVQERSSALPDRASVSAVSGYAGQAGVPTTERLQAAYLLTAAAMAAMEGHRHSAAESALRLARSAVAAYRCLMTSYALADACVRWGSSTGDLERRTAAYETALTMIEATLSEVPLEEPSSLTLEAAGYVVRMCWLLVEVGASNQARAPLNAVLEAHPAHYMALLLLCLMQTCDGDYASANAAVLHLLKSYPDDVVGVVLHAAVERRAHVAESADTHGRDGEDAAKEAEKEELAVAMARIMRLTEAADAAEKTGLRKKSLKGLCTHCAPGEEVEGGPANSFGELRRRVVGHWALLSHVASRLGCTTMAELAVTGGTDYATQCPLFFHRGFADLQCSAARVSLTRLQETLAAQQVTRHGAALLPSVRDSNLLGLWDRDALATEAAPLLGLPLTAASDTGSTSPGVSKDGAGRQLLSSKALDAVAATLAAALEASPTHAEARTLLGVTRLLEAAQADLPADTRHNRLQEASRHLHDAICGDGVGPEAYMGAGAVAEAQGALGESFDFYVSAAEVATQAPLVDWSYFRYLYE